MITEKVTVRNRAMIENLYTAILCQGACYRRRQTEYKNDVRWATGRDDSAVAKNYSRASVGKHS